MSDYTDGQNRDNKYRRDVDLLLSALRDKYIDPTLKSRYIFYLAQSYRDLKQYDKSIKYYKQRIELGGWEEEVFCCYYQIGLAYLIKEDTHNALEYLLKAYNYRPTRIEPLYQLAKYYRINKQYHISKIFLGRCLKAKELPNDMMFVEKLIYSYLPKVELVYLLKHINEIESGRILADGLIHDMDVHISAKTEILNNIKEYVPSLALLCKSFKSRKYYIEKEHENHNLMNPTIIYHNNQYIINTREVNYTFDIENNKYNAINTIDTYNKIMICKDIDNIPTNTSMLIENIDENITTYFNVVTGYEDLRLFILNDTLYASCTCLKTNPLGIPEICLLKLIWIDNKYNIEKVTRLKIDIKQMEEKCHKKFEDLHKRTEKNWTPFIHNNELYFIYTFQPMIILKPNIETGICTVYEYGINSIDMTTYRGGSQMIKVNDYYICIVHQVAFDGKRRYYYHRFVFMNDELRIKKVSPIFSFSNNPTIEYCAGMCFDGKQLVITYGFEDKEPYIATVNHLEVLDLSL